MKIAFYVTNKNISQVDFRTVEKGNPGVGGSEFSAILVSTVLCRNKNIETILLCDENSLFSDDLKWFKCVNLLGAIRFCKKYGYDYLVVDAKLLEKNIVRYSNMKFIAWANTFIPETFLHFYSCQSNIVKVVNVGREQHEIYKHLKIYEKSCYIYNAVPTSVISSYKQKLLPNAQREANVVYIGSLFSAKGFHVLAQVWPEVIKKVPNAQLFVIGSGKLYSRKSKLGKWGIASEEYENEFMQYLAPGGKLMPSVHFLGILAEEKYDVLSKCKVGIPNPSGVSETFGYTAVEMQLMDCLVTTIKCPGYIDTVYDKKNLYDSTDQLGDKIIGLLNSKNDIHLDVINYVSNFAVNKVVAQWELLFSSFGSNETVSPLGWKRRLILEGHKIISYLYIGVYSLLKKIFSLMKKIYVGSNKNMYGSL